MTVSEGTNLAAGELYEVTRTDLCGRRTESVLVVVAETPSPSAALSIAEIALGIDSDSPLDVSHRGSVLLASGVDTECERPNYLDRVEVKSR